VGGYDIIRWFCNYQQTTATLKYAGHIAVQPSLGETVLIRN